MIHLYDSNMSEIEAMIQRHAPAMMKAGAGPGTGGIRGEARPKSTPENRTKYRLISPEMSVEIMAMYAEGVGKTDIAAHFRLSAEAIRDHIGKRVVKRTKEQLSELRSGPYSNVAKANTNKGT